MKKKHKIQICLGSSCFTRGNATNAQIIEDFVKSNQLDSEIDYRGHLCKEQCMKSPVITINDTEYHHVTKENIKDILNTELGVK